MVLAVALASTLALSVVHGTVLIDPARPVCMVGVPCSAPDKGEVLVFWRGTTKAATAVTHADGSFRVALPPGLYRLSLPRRAPRASFAPRQIPVPRGRGVGVTIRVDVGIR